MSVDIMSRVLADARDRPAWLRARIGKIGGSDAASFAKLESAPLYLRAKLHSPFRGNIYTAHGHAREEQILARYRIPQNTYLFHHPDHPRHVATPDGIVVEGSRVILAQVKTSEKPIPAADRIPPAYRRQMWWEQWVMGADRTLLIWERHTDFQPVDMEPAAVWFDRDDDEIEKLVTIADYVLEGMDAAERFANEMMAGARS